ncbi:PAP2 family protein [Peribacillus asahii]|uniref:PAP2 family protein n=1 Tax=Peribacillus asahii TaxID=228899 RepID=A0A398BAV3_9BACI|nr:phosphatase PAP2 family protein [Peribacillus asahii]RID84753.1 PAP2 family protein [Peribacillus asahii]
MGKDLHKSSGTILIGGIVSLLIFFVMMLGVQKEFILSFDHSVQDIFSGTGEGALHFFEGVSAMGSTAAIAGGSLLFLLWLWFVKKHYVAMAIFAVGVGGGNLLNKFVKNSIERERPVGSAEAEAMSYSFPSGHTMVGLVFYVLLAYFITKEIKSGAAKWWISVVVVVLMLVMGVSRIAVNAHFMSDVIAGYALGAVWSLICIYVFRKIVSQ